MAAATVNAEYPLGGVPLSAEFRLNNISVSPAVGTAQTSFTVTNPGIGPGAKLIHIFALNSAAAAVGQVVGTISGTTLTCSFAECDLLGTEEFMIQFSSQP